MASPIRFVVAVVAVCLGLVGTAEAQPARIPEGLAPWVPWVTANTPTLGCAVGFSPAEQTPVVRTCAWPGRLALDLDQAGGRFRLEAFAEVETTLELPGDATIWPRSLKLDGNPARLVGGAGPTVALPPGAHLIEGAFVWPRAPETLAVPPGIALVDLTLDGKTITFPGRETDGTLRLARRDDFAVEADALEVEVQRRLADGIPLQLETRVVLRVAGRAREIVLPPLLPEGIVPAWLVGELPARLEPDGSLAVQLRPGEWGVSLFARSAGNLASVQVPQGAEPWPAEELWSFEPAPELRAARLAGGRPIDPARTTIPDGWKRLATVLARGGESLQLNELRRGEPTPAPNEIVVVRHARLSLDGDDLVIRDRLDGTLHESGRLDVVAPAQLGRAALDGEDQVVSLDPSGSAGVEVRSGVLALEADLELPRRGALRAVGWQLDAASVAWTLELPPGWRLLAAPGVDRATGSWVAEWSLLDLFLLLVIVLATERLVSRRVALVAAVALTLAWHESGVGWVIAGWLLVLPLLGLEQLVASRPGRLLTWLVRLRAIAGVVLLVALAGFAAIQWRNGFFPQLDDGAVGGGFAPQNVNFQGVPSAAAPEPSYDMASSREYNQAPESPVPRSKSKLQEVDPAAIVQTGPGVATWSWRSYALSYSGPVDADHELRVLLVSPGINRVLALLRIGLLGWLAFVVLARRTPRGSSQPSAASEAPGWQGTAAAVVLLFASLLVSSRAVAQTFPPPELLADLATRLAADPPCAPRCLEVAAMRLEPRGGRLVVAVELHASAATTFRIPGPAAEWLPERVTVDGAPTAALRLADDGVVEVRVPVGVHRLELEGPARDGFTLQLPDRPRTLSVATSDWIVAGFREDQPPPAALRLDRQLERGPEAATAATQTAGLSPWLVVRRRLEIGLRSTVTTEVERIGPADAPLVVRVPLLAGEAVTSAGVAVADGEATLAFERGETMRSWSASLATEGTIELVGAAGGGLFETWELACSSLWRCDVSGLVPLTRMDGGQALWRWRPWPGERVSVAVGRVPAAGGETATYDRIAVRVEPGRRLTESSLDLSLRTSRGGEHVVAIPTAATVLSVTVDGVAVPATPREGRLALALDPGSRSIVVRFREDHGAELVTRVPALTLDAPGVDVETVLALPSDRWILAVGGPSWGPVVRMWLSLLVIALAAAVLGVAAPTPLRVFDWFLLGVGMSQLPLPAAAWVALTLAVLGWRAHRPAERWWTWNLQQLGLAFALLISAVVLYGAIHTGLLMHPDMQIGGAGSHGSELRWYVDRIDGALPEPWVLSLPLWTWRVAMLAWALWLASRVLRWAPWVWARLADGPLLARPGWRRGQDDANSGREEASD